jgi:hypothetical protein
MEDSIVWTLMPNGEYSMSSAYNAQFFGATNTCMNKMVWKAWAPPKLKFFAWLTTQNRIWTTDRLEKRGWNNCGLCQLCKQTQESATHLFAHCRFTKRLWGMVKEWLGLPSIRVHEWSGELSIDEWWSSMSYKASLIRKAMTSLTMLVSWTIWKERNARVLSAPPPILLEIIKSEAKLWIAVGLSICDL